MSYLIILIVFWLGRLLLNISRFHRTSLLKAIYEDYACGKNNKAVQHRNEIISLFKYADIQQEIIVDHTTMGHKIINSTPYPIFSNMFNRYANLEKETLMYFDYAIGTYKKRIKENFRISFLIETIIYLPKNIINYLQFDINIKTSNLINFIYWIIGIIVTIYTFETKNLINSFIDYLMSFIHSN